MTVKDQNPGPSQQSSCRVLIVKLSALGDLFHVLPAVHVVKQRLDATIDWVAHPEYAGLVSCFTDVGRVICYPRRRFAALFPFFMRELRAERYDLVLDFQGLLKSALTARLARGGRRIGPARCREGAGLFYALRPPAVSDSRTARHAVLEALDVVRCLGLEAGDPVFPVKFPEVVPAGASPRIGLVPGSRWPSKNWPVEKFGIVADALHAKYGGSFYILGGPKDRRLCLALSEKRSADVFHDMCGSLDLVKLAGILQSLDLLITNDTGPMHIAAAVGTPVVAVFGPTSPQRTGPWGSGHQVLRADSPPRCSPCFRRRCKRGGDCLGAITEENVFNAAARVLESLGK